MIYSVGISFFFVFNHPQVVQVEKEWSNLIGDSSAPYFFSKSPGMTNRSHNDMDGRVGTVQMSRVGFSRRSRFFRVKKPRRLGIRTAAATGKAVRAAAGFPPSRVSPSARDRGPRTNRIQNISLCCIAQYITTAASAWSECITIARPLLPGDAI